MRLFLPFLMKNTRYFFLFIWLVGIHPVIAQTDVSALKLYGTTFTLADSSLFHPNIIQGMDADFILKHQLENKNTTIREPESGVLIIIFSKTINEHRKATAASLKRGGSHLPMRDQQKKIAR
jgi:hypothetical protein